MNENDRENLRLEQLYFVQFQKLAETHPYLKNIMKKKP